MIDEYIKRTAFVTVSPKDGIIVINKEESERRDLEQIAGRFRSATPHKLCSIYNSAGHAIIRRWVVVDCECDGVARCCSSIAVLAITYPDCCPEYVGHREFDGAMDAVVDYLND